MSPYLGEALKISRLWLRRKFLRDANPQRRQPRSGRIVHFSLGGIGQGKSRRSYLQTELLFLASGSQAVRHHIPGLHSGRQDPESSLDGLFLVRVERAAYRWHRQKSFLEIKFIVLYSSPMDAAQAGFRVYRGSSIGDAREAH
jgi:hypothetical protein